MYESKKSLKPIIISIAIIVVIAIVAVVISIILNHNYLSTHSSIIQLDFQPRDATILIDGGPQTPDDNNTIRVTPGSHSIAVLRSGFFPDGEEFTIEANETYDTEILLQPFTEEAKKIAEDYDY